jgi:parallel beta helix pectate lyase-like protein
VKEESAAMQKLRAVRNILAGVMTTLLVSASAHAQATRTWVSGVGDDANPCSRTAPCKTFAGAISKTATGGEIDALDPGGFGVVTITKSMTIDGTTGGGFGSILAAGVTGVIINAGTGVVTLRNLSINGAGTGVAGIRILAASKVYVEDSVIFGFQATSGTAAGIGINDERSAGGALFVTNTTIRNNSQSGISIVPNTTATTASLSNVRLEGNGNAGLAVSHGAVVNISNSVASNNTFFGLYADTAGSVLTVESCIATGNGVGINSGPGTSVVRISNTTVQNNGVGLQMNGGTINSFQNNKVVGNTAGNGPPSNPITVQ